MSYYRCCCINEPVYFSHCVHLKLAHRNTMPCWKSALIVTILSLYVISQRCEKHFSSHENEVDPGDKVAAVCLRFIPLTQHFFQMTTSDPKDWTKEQTIHWFHWAITEFNIEYCTIPKELHLAGTELCKLTKRFFIAQLPKAAAELMWSHLDLLKKCEYYIWTVYWNTCGAVSYRCGRSRFVEIVISLFSSNKGTILKYTCKCYFGKRLWRWFQKYLLLNNNY